ncbi:MAG: Na/Pi cotransporter family protein, partial [Planctomycetota bacterium]
MGDLVLGPLLMGLFGGLAVFLFGLQQMTDALRSVAGAGMSRVLATLTRSRFTAAITGAFVTAVIQSSSVTTVLVVGFISAGLLSLQQSIGVIMGANIGTTITAQVIAFKVTQYALALIAVGFAASMLTKRKPVRRYGAMLIGLGMIFLGMGFMSEATEPLRSHQPFIDLMRRMSNPLVGIAVAAVFTALVQSSSATTGIVIVLASKGFISLEAGIALAFGANIGTCVTAVLAAIGRPREAAQASLVHLVFNVLGVIVWLPLIGWLATVVLRVSPSHPELEGAARLAAETPRQIANAHTLFNVANTCLFIWFTGPLAKIVARVLPIHPEVLPERARPRYLQEVYIETPHLALDGIQRETVRLGKHIVQLGQVHGAQLFLGTTGDLGDISAWGRDNQRLYDSINEYIRQLSSTSLSATESRRLAALTAIASYVQNVGETIAMTYLQFGRERKKRDVRFSAETTHRIGELAARVREAFESSLRAIEDASQARRIIEMKPEIQRLQEELVDYLSVRLLSDDPDRIVLFRMETQIVEVLQRE